MRKNLLFYFLLMLFIRAGAQQFPSGATAKNLTYKIIPSADKTWGYDIYNNDKLFVHQPSVPGLAGNAGFAIKIAAKKVAEKSMKKLRQGESPPTVSID